MGRVLENVAVIVKIGRKEERSLTRDHVTFRLPLENNREGPRRRKLSARAHLYIDRVVNSSKIIRSSNRNAIDEKVYSENVLSARRNRESRARSGKKTALSFGEREVSAGRYILSLFAHAKCTMRPTILTPKVVFSHLDVLTVN